MRYTRAARDLDYDLEVQAAGLRDEVSVAEEDLDVEVVDSDSS